MTGLWHGSEAELEKGKRGICCTYVTRQAGLPEKGKCVDELTKQSGVLLLLGEDWGFCCEAIGTPEPTGCPVCERPWDAQLSDQGKDVVILNSRTRTFPFMLCMEISLGGTVSEMQMLLLQAVCTGQLA